jgi:hypothetical protein
MKAYFKEVIREIHVLEGKCSNLGRLDQSQEEFQGFSLFLIDLHPVDVPAHFRVLVARNQRAIVLRVDDRHLVECRLRLARLSYWRCMPISATSALYLWRRKVVMLK